MVSEHVVERFSELLERFARHRPRLIVPAEVAEIGSQISGLRSNASFVLGDLGISLRALVILAHSEAPPTMGELGAELGVALSSATRIVDWLSDAGCVERIDDPHDRRIVRVRMTDHGRQLYQVGVNHYKERIAGLLRDFSGDEQAELLRLMTKLLDSMLTADGAGGVTPG